MKISITNEAKLNAVLDEVQGRSTARTVSAGDIIYRLGKIRVPKSRLHGTTVHYDGAEHFPNAYKYVPESTHWIAENVNGRWYVTDIYRGICPNRKSWDTVITYSESAKQWILEDASHM